jgi:hypothetical protein
LPASFNRIPLNTVIRDAKIQGSAPCNDQTDGAQARYVENRGAVLAAVQQPA